MHYNISTHKGTLNWSNYTVLNAGIDVTHVLVNVAWPLTAVYKKKSEKKVKINKKEIKKKEKKVKRKKKRKKIHIRN